MDRKIVEITLMVFALIFVILLSVTFGHVVGFGNKANNQVYSIEQAIVEADLEQYDNKVVSGDTVISTVNKMRELKNGTKMSYAVKADGTWIAYGHSAITAVGSIDTIDGAMVGAGSTDYTKYEAQVGDPGFVSPVDSYKSKVVANENGVIIGVAFEKILLLYD